MATLAGQWCQYSQKLAKQAKILEEIMNVFPSADQDYNLWTLLVRTREAMYRARQKELDTLGITPRQAATLFVIKTLDDKATPSEIARMLIRQPHSVSESLSRMEKQGLVVRAKDWESKRRVKIVLTEKGRKVCKQSMKRESIHRIISSLSEEERHQLASCLQNIMTTSLKETANRLRENNTHIGILDFSSGGHRLGRTH